jgi:hypothetical protein
MRKMTWTLTIAIFFISETIFSLWLSISSLHTELLSIVTLLAIYFAQSVLLCSRLSHWQNKFQLTIAIVARVMYPLSLTTLFWEASQILFCHSTRLAFSGYTCKTLGWGAICSALLEYLTQSRDSVIQTSSSLGPYTEERRQRCLLIRIFWVIRIY